MVTFTVRQSSRIQIPTISRQHLTRVTTFKLFANQFENESH